jgi:hypothetical protein
MCITRVCARCDQEIPVHGPELCCGCINEQVGVCRWCGIRPPASGSELCTKCEDSGSLAAELGSFEAAIDVLRFRSELDAH